MPAFLFSLLLFGNFIVNYCIISLIKLQVSETMNRRNQQTQNQEVVFDKNTELVSTTDLRGVITYANPAFCQVSGYTAAELVGKTHNMVRHPGDAKSCLR